MSYLSIFRITSNGLKSTPNITEPEKVIEMNGHIIGMTISPDKKFLFVNVRGWPANAVPNQDQAPAINENIELRIINLKTLEFESEVMIILIIFLLDSRTFYGDLYSPLSHSFIECPSRF